MPTAFRLPGCLLAATVLALSGCRHADPPRPNIVLIVIDTQRKDHLGCYGNPRPVSRAIDSLAADSIRYENAFSQAPWTTPSVGSLLTSRYPWELGIRGEPDRIGDEQVLLAEVLRQNGYHTGAAISHFFLSRKWNFDQGFDYFDERWIQGHAGVCSHGVSNQGLHFLRSWAAAREGGSDDHEPFFLFLHYFDPHYNYISHERFPFAEELTYDGPITSGMRHEELFEMTAELSDADRDYLLALYDSEVAYTDFHIGRVLGYLRHNRLYDDSLIILTADHGEEFLDHGQLGHSKTVFNELTNVPLLMKYPNQAEGLVARDYIGLIDLMPTLLSYLQIPAPGPMSGVARSVPPDGAKGPVFSETSRLDADQVSVVRDGYKLIWDRKADRLALFDLRTDPGEREDLAADRADVVTQMKSLFWLWKAGSGTGDGGTPDAVEITEEERRALESLGYLRD